MVAGLLFAITSILATEVVLAAALVGIGLGVRRMAGLAELTLDDCFTGFWVGFAVTILLLIGWNFALPIGAGAMAAVLSLGVLGLWVSRAGLARLKLSDPWRPSRLVVIGLVVLMLWIANLAMGRLGNWDSSLYHIQGVRWAREYPVVPGLANLHGPLGFNNGAFLFFAMLNVGPWADRGNHLGNGLLLSVFVAQAVIALGKFATGPLDQRPRQLFLAVFLPMALNATFGEWISSYGTDLGKTLLLSTFLARWYGFLTEPTGDSRREAHDFVTLTLLAAGAVCLKFNAAVFSGLALVLTAVLWIKVRGSHDRTVRRAIGAAVAIGVVFAALWGARGIILSGYPFFPSRFLGVPVEWRAAAEHADAEFAYIQHSGRASVALLDVVRGTAGFSAWFPNWLSGAIRDPVAWLVPIAVAIGAWVASRRRSTATAHGIASPAWMLIPIGVDLVVWFMATPELRYVTYQLWGLAGLALAEGYRRRIGESGPAPRPWLVLIAVLAILPRVVTPLTVVGHEGLSPARRLWIETVVLPGSDHGFRPIAGSPELAQFVTRSGLTLNVPVRNQHCWDAPLPCTENPAPNLRLRVPGQIRSGFVIEGPWEMLNWPYVWRKDFLPAWREGRAEHSSR